MYNAFHLLMEDFPKHLQTQNCCNVYRLQKKVNKAEETTECEGERVERERMGDGEIHFEWRV